MSAAAIVAIGLGAAVGGVLLAAAILQLRHRRRIVATAVIVDPVDHTTADDLGAVRSIQAADLTMPADALEAIWTPMHLERLARTYWRFLTRATLGLVRVEYTSAERRVVLISRPLVLLRFSAPEYAMDVDRGVVRWRIESGLLVSARDGTPGYLQIDVSRGPAAGSESVTIHVEVEVTNFYPRIASGISMRLYRITQSRLHVIITHGFLRSLARLDLAESRVGRFARTSTAAGSYDQVPDPPVRREAPTERSHESA